jgi:hypothetical protein
LCFVLHVVQVKSGALELVSEFSAGLIFALGLVSAGMVRPTKVRPLG